MNLLLGTVSESSKALAGQLQTRQAQTNTKIGAVALTGAAVAVYAAGFCLGPPWLVATFLYSWVGGAMAASLGSVGVGGAAVAVGGGLILAGKVTWQGARFERRECSRQSWYHCSFHYYADRYLPRVQSIRSNSSLNRQL